MKTNFLKWNQIHKFLTLRSITNISWYTPSYSLPVDSYNENTSIVIHTLHGGWFL